MVKKDNNKAQDLMAELLEKQKIVPIKKGKEIDAEIVSFSKKGVIFNIGGKANAVLGERELKDISTYLPYFKKGAIIRGKIISEESKNGYPVLSLQKFFEKGKWEILVEKKEKEEEIEIVCGEYGKGGVFIDFMGIRGVIPKIQLVGDYLTTPEKLHGKKIKVKILEVSKEKNRLVVSQKASVLKISQKELKERFEKIKKGDKYKAKILGVSEFGAFCEVEGVEGLIHISEVSWEKVNNAKNHIRTGETVEVMVVEKNPTDIKLNLSLKRLTDDPWKDIEKKYPKEKEAEGEIIRNERYGYFVKLEPGIEGLIHISKLTGEENFKIGQKVKVFVERIIVKERRMSLILPQKVRPVTYR